MSCVITYHLGGRVTVRGGRPRKPSTWTAKAWFVMPSGEKYTHEATVPGQTVGSLVPFMGALIDSLIADHGRDVASCGWQAMTHGGK